MSDQPNGGDSPVTDSPLPAAGTSTITAINVPDASSWDTVAPIEQIYKQIQNLFCNGPTSVFQMEVPCRPLDRGTYDYKGSDTINAQQIKPPLVGEAEFRLSDDLYSLANLVGGPNGSKLSTRYEDILFSLIPNTDGPWSQAFSEMDLENDQDRIRAWLDEKVPNIDPPTTDVLAGIPVDLGLRVSTPPQRSLQARSQDFRARTDTAANPVIARVDLYHKLLDTYEGEKTRWEQYRVDARPRGDAKQSELNAYDELLQTYAPAVDAKLEALWTLVVVRGQYHRVRTYVSHMDLESASEALQQAKEKLRSCVSRSIDDSQDIYPVVFSPANWAAYLSSSFQPTGLPDNAATGTTVLQALSDAEKGLAMLQAKRSELLGNSQSVANAKAALHSAQAAFEEACTSLSHGLTDSVLGLVKMYFNAVISAGLAAETDPIVAVRNLTTVSSGINDLLAAKGHPRLANDAWARLCTAQQSCMMRQTQLNAAQDNCARAQTEAAEASAVDSKLLLYTLEDQIMSKQKDVEDYQRILRSITSPTGVSVSIPGTPQSTDMDTIPATAAPRPPTSLQVPDVPGGASVWQTITVRCKASGDDTENMVKEEVDDTTTSTTGRCLFWSSSSAVTTTTTPDSSSSSSQTPDHSNTDVQVGFNITKVDIERPWMDAGLLNQSQIFCHALDAPIARYDPAAVSDALRSLQAYRQSDDSSTPGLLPSFPTSFIVAKDIHIIYTSPAGGFSDSTLRHVHSCASSSSSPGGGFLCFPSSAGIERNPVPPPGVHVVDKTSVSSASDTISIKIPAPHIIGWISELVARDTAQPQYTRLPPPADEDFY
ncbi:hypothetical protein NLU13_1775 [Sarocladium strictum]|uniref:Uncharacterized protein n=1 Tax=Sarocladium strictum TaxID=5046 RepID=A0AA39GSD0_SARSR|nr:hypothetical protein NLU13_1775 [Sarocladium strictum]